MLDSQILGQLRGVMDMVRDPVTFAASVDDSERSQQMRQMLTQVAELSDKITFIEETNERTPSFAIRSSGREVRFAGLPLGHEFNSFVLALLQVSGHPVKADAEIIAAAQAIDTRCDFVTYMSLSCQNCPDVVQALNALAVLNPLVTHVAVEGGAFSAEIDEKGIQAVPTVYLNGEFFESGRLSLAQIVGRLDSGAKDRMNQRLNETEPFDVLVVGGGPAGAAAAIYAARKGLSVGVAAERIGGQVNDTAAIENLIVVDHTTGGTVAGGLAENLRANGVEIFEDTIATKLHERTGEHVAVDFGDATLRGKTVILATGAKYRTTGVPGEDEYRNKGVTFCPHCDGPLFKGKEVAVIGGGNSAIEAAIDLAGITKHVTVVELMPQLNADQVLQDKLASLPNTTVITGAKTQQIHGDGTGVTALEIETDGVTKKLPVQGVFVQIGLVPNTDWLEGTLTLERGEIPVNARGETALPGVFAAGDCTNTPFKQIVVALGSGASAALGAFDHMIRQ
ncbi:MAG: alkyl hydroperoxide reductase subunit F [Actinomycetaceae bacterium]|nr:alkyl hydroperoxide reductase subunit F [Actinomycetaceae bacterium]